MKLSRLSELVRRAAEGPPKWDEIKEQLEDLAAGQDLGGLRTTIERSLTTVQGWEADLNGALAKVSELEAKLATRDQYSEVWWGKRRREIEARLEAEPRAGMAELARTFADTLAAGEWETCARIGHHDWYAPEGADEALELLARLGEALVEERRSLLPHFLERLARLAWPPAEGPLLDPPRQAVALALSARVILYMQSGTDFLERAMARANAAALRAPASGLAHACLGDVYRVSGDFDSALTEYQQALDRPYGESDSLIGLALLAEGRGAGSDARQWYEAAADSVSESRRARRALGSTLIVVPGAAYLALARALRDEDRPDDALVAVRAALDAGVEPGSGFGGSEAHSLRAELLEAMGDKKAAAIERHQAGVALSDEGRVAEAIGELGRSLEDDPRQEAYWELADALRVHSYKEGEEFADRDLLAESLDNWTRAYELGPPLPDQSWVYTAIGLIYLERARWPRGGDSTDLWEAIGWIERGLAVTAADGIADNEAAWIQLSRLYGDAGLSGIALMVARHATLVVAPAQLPAWDQHAAAAANWGDYEDAREAIERADQLRGSPAEDVPLFVELKVGDRKAALEKLDGILDDDPKSLWALELRGFYRGVEDLPGADEDYRRIVALYDGKRRDDFGAFGYAAYRIGELDRAREILGVVLEDPSLDDSSSHFILALCELAAGETDRARATADDALSRPHGPRLLDEFLWDTRHLLSVGSLGDEGRRAAEDVVADLERLIAASVGPQPESELRAALRDYGDSSKVAWSAWLGLARVLREAGRCGEAADTAMAASKIEPSGNEPAAAVRAAVARLGAQATQLVGLDRPEAAEMLAEAADIAARHLPDDPQLHAHLVAAESAVQVLHGNREDGLHLFARALEGLPHDGTVRGAAVAEAACAGLRSARDLWAIRNAFAELRDSAGAGAAPDWDAAAGVAYAYAQRQLGLLEEPYWPADLRPLVRLGAGLIPDDTGPDWALFARYVPDMRARIQADTGLTVPAILFQAKPGDEGGGYEIELDGVVQARGEVHLGHQFCPSKPAGLVGIRDHDPVTGDSGVWVLADESELEESQPDPWQEPLVYVVRHIEAVLRANLDGFVDLDVVEALLDSWSLDTAAARTIEQLLPRRKERVVFARIVRALVAEMVPVTDWRSVLEPLKQFSLDGADVGPAVAAIRAAMGNRLPGRDPLLQRVSVPDSWMDEIAAALRGERTGSGAGLPAALEAVRAQLTTLPAPLEAGAVLVAPDAGSRTLLSRLVAVVAPHVPVIAADELPDDGSFVVEPSTIVPEPEHA